MSPTGSCGGCQFFSGGPSAAQPAVQTATQTVAFSEAEPEITAGTVTATLSAYLGGYLTQADNAKVEVMLRDASGGTVGSIPLAPVTAAERANQTTLVRRAATLLVPTTARSALIVLTATRTGGDANDGYADNLSFSLDGSTPGPPSTACLPDLDGDKFDNATDCNDNDASIHPGAADVPEDGIDQDCAGGDAINLDRDRDGYNRPQDCADGNAAIHPGAADVPEDGIDQDCAGGDAINLDRDRDGYNRPQDCNDAGAGVHPGATDTPGNGVDEDCSGKDAAFPRITSPVTMRWSVHKVLGTRVLGLTVKDAPEGAKVRVSCTRQRMPVQGALAQGQARRPPDQQPLQPALAASRRGRRDPGIARRHGRRGRALQDPLRRAVPEALRSLPRARRQEGQKLLIGRQCAATGRGA